LERKKILEKKLESRTTKLKITQKNQKTKFEAEKQFPTKNPHAQST